MEVFHNTLYLTWHYVTDERSSTGQKRTYLFYWYFCRFETNRVSTGAYCPQDMAICPHSKSDTDKISHLLLSTQLLCVTKQTFSHVNEIIPTLNSVTNSLDYRVTMFSLSSIGSDWLTQFKICKKNNNCFAFWFKHFYRPQVIFHFCFGNDTTYIWVSRV